MQPLLFRKFEITTNQNTMSNLQKVSLLTFIKKIATDRALYQCECGNTTETRISSVNNLHTTSCGCVNKKRASKMATKHGLCYHPLARIRDAIKRRCFNKNCAGYSLYGGRGITICKEWSESYEAFITWCLANGWQPGLEIDRIDNNGNYEPRNCRFTTRLVQANNTRRNIYIEVNGETKTLKQWCNILNVHYGNAQNRITNQKVNPLIALGLKA